MTTMTPPPATSEINAVPPVDEGFDPRVALDVMLTSVADQVVGYNAAQETPVLPSVYSTQKVIPDLYVNELGVAMLIYREPLPTEVWWVEYDPRLRRLIFVGLTGQVFDLGAEIHENIDYFLRVADRIYLIKTSVRGDILQNDERKLVVRGNGRNI